MIADGMNYLATMKVHRLCISRGFSHDVTAAIPVSQNNETVVMLVHQTNPVGVQLFSCEVT